ncbi:Gag-Pol polyprotein [Gossypium australe]|uniref:Gag-Pol polyprotein n=1 Tax=Gossypium australe TaxID=47621 RepID=A0A5B6URN5_9ROSI|nr:Gag-Pol polyprotein [Gossypium australe]
MDPNQAEVDDVKSNVPTPAQGTKPSEVDQVFDELSCTPNECLKCVVSLLRDSAYRWWKTLVSIAPRERVNWEFFQYEFRKKYISQQLLDKKRNEVLELKQGQMSVTEYEREFVRLSKYAQECVSTEAIMCKRFEDGLNEDIRVLFGVLELKEFVVLFDQACKTEELSKEKTKAESEARDARKSPMTGYSNRDRGKQYSGSKAQTTSVASVGNARSGRLECQHCGRRHLDKCRMNDRACFKCSFQDHFIRDSPEMAEKDKIQKARSGNTATRGRPPRNIGNVTNSKGVTKDSTVKSEARAPARAYAIRAREEATSPNVITATFSLYDTNVIALIDPGSTHSYVCVNLVSSKIFPVEFTEFVIKVLNLLGKYVLVDKVCKNCPLMIRGHYFLADLILFPFDEFDVILGMDWLTLHDAVVNCRLKTIELKCDNGEVLRVETDESGELPIVISSIAAQIYVRKGCEAYLTYVLNTKMSELKPESVSIVYEYLDVFPEELPGLPPIREVDFGIDLVPGTSPILIAPSLGAGATSSSPRSFFRHRPSPATAVCGGAQVLGGADSGGGRDKGGGSRLRQWQSKWGLGCGAT